MQSFWDERYASQKYIYGEEPNPQLKYFIDRNTPGKILFPGEGEGRNAVYAAMQNWKVVAIDQSNIAKIKAEALATKHGVKIDYTVGDIITNSYPTRSFDAIALSFFHLPPQVRNKVHTYLASLLKPGGILFIVGFSKQQINYNSGGPSNIDMLYSTKLLLEEFNDFQIVTNQQFESHLNEGDGHDGLASLIEFEAVKK